MLVTIAAAACCALGQPLAAPGEGKRYDGDKVVTVIVKDDRMHRSVLGLSEGLWGCAESRPGVPMQLLVSPEAIKALDDLGVTYIVEIDNVQRMLDAENARLADEARKEGVPPLRGELPGTYFDDYRTSQQISDYMNALMALRPDLVTRQAIGTSLEGREIYAIRVTAPGGGPKPIILMNAVQHAREWITGSTGSYIMDQLVRNPDADPRIDALVNDFEIILVPVLNPDGYAYTWSNDRMWRKNRRPPPDTSGCYGVDNNRNWGAFWGSGDGSSGQACSETYRGTGAFSEPENQAMRDFTLTLPGVVAYIDIHCYGRHILSPWGYRQAPPENIAELYDEFNNGLMERISAVNGIRWRGGPTYANLYSVSGGSKDWYLSDRGVMGWVWELRDEGSFVLPPSNILPAAREVFAGVLELGDLIREYTLHVRFMGPGRAARTSSTGPTPLRFVLMRGVSEPSTDSDTTRLWCRVGRVGAFTQATLTLGEGGVRSGELPAAPCGAVVQYYIEGATAAGTPYLNPSGGAAAPYEATVSDPEMFAAFDMETPAGWSGWSHGEPNGTAAQPEYAQQGVNCWVTSNSSLPGSRLDANDVDGLMRHTSNAINLAGRTNVTVSYWRWYSANIGAGPNLDPLLVEVSSTGVTGSYVTAETVGPGGPEARRGWFEHSFLLNTFITPTSQTRLRFSANDNAPDTYMEAAVDNVSIFRERCAAPCPGDWTRNGVVDAADVAELISAWFEDQVNGTLVSDFDRNGISNSTDVGEFINAWFTPCL